MRLNLHNAESPNSAALAKASSFLGLGMQTFPAALIAISEQTLANHAERTFLLPAKLTATKEGKQP